MTLYLSAVWTQSGESGNTLNNQVQWYGRRESKHLFRAYNVRSRVQQPMFGERQNAVTLTKQASAKTTEWSGSPRLLAHSTANKKPRRNLRGNALWDRPRKQTRNSFERTLSVETSGSIYDSPTAVPQLPKKKPRHRCRQQRLEDIVHNVSRCLRVMQQAYSQCQHGRIVASEKLFYVAICRHTLIKTTISQKPNP